LSEVSTTVSFFREERRALGDSNDELKTYVQCCVLFTEEIEQLKRDALETDVNLFDAAIK